MMMRFVLLCAVLPGAVKANDGATQANPIEKVIEMLGDLQQKIIGEGKAAQQVYDEFAEWCEEESKNLQYEIKTGKSESDELNAGIEKAVADQKELDEHIGTLTGTLSTDEADLKAATSIRDKEHALFITEEAELVDDVDILERAIGILEREMAKNPGAALVQVKNQGNLIDALSVLLKASSISAGDSARLTALIQNKGKEKSLEEEASEEGLGAPDPAAYKSQSGGIVDVLTGMLDESQSMLAELRKKETDSQHNYDVLKVELDDAIKFTNSEIDKAQKKLAAAGQEQATLEGDLAIVTKALAEDMNQLAETHHDCMTKAQAFEAETQARAEELKALAEAKKIITEMTGGAAGQAYSFIQVNTKTVSRIRTRADLTNFEVIHRVQSLARQLHSPALAQLAQRMEAAVRLNSKSGDDPFAKVKGLIADMIETLLKEAEEDAAQHGWCTKEMEETKLKKEQLNDEVTALSTKIDKMTSDSAQLKEEVALLSKELADLAKSQAEMDKIRGEEKSDYDKNKAEMEQGIEGITLALKVLREYYSSGAGAQGAGGGIISMLEVIEADFNKELTEIVATEEAAVEEYEKVTKDNEIAKVTKTQDVKYKTKEAKGLDEAVAEKTSDKASTQSELDSVLEYWKSLQEQCIDKVEPYEERKKRREAEIAGLKEALEILNGEAVLLQKETRTKKKLRGVTRHAA